MHPAVFSLLAALAGVARLSPAAAQAECLSARSCEELQAQYSEIGGFPFRVSGSEDICAESDSGLGPGGSTQCFTDSFEAARSICYEAGARLCTIDEILLGATGNTGCNLNSELIWSSSPCAGGAPGIATSHGNARLNVPEGQPPTPHGEHGPPSCEPNLATELGIRCCADGEAIRAGRSLCDVYAAEQGGCTSVLNCAQLAARDDASQPARVTWPVSEGMAAVCGESDAGLGEDYTVQCFPAATWPGARAICDGTGARLCTVEELQGDVTAGTGCNGDLLLNWSSDDIGCDPGQHVQVIGNSVHCDARCTAKGAGAHCVDDETASAVRCCADAVVVHGSDCDEVVAQNLCALPGVTVTLGGEVETATGRPTTYSGTGNVGQGFRGGQPASLVDDIHDPSSWSDAPFGDCASCDERLFLTLDLGTNFPLTGVTIWHYYGDTRAYCSQKVAISQSSDFAGEEVVVYDTGTGFGAEETETGNSIAFDRTVARFVRHWSSRSTANTGVHFMEIDVIGLAQPQFASCEVTLHEHYVLHAGNAIRGGGAPSPCYDATHPKWRTASSLFYDNVHECEDVCDSDENCIGFVHNLAADPPYCVLKAAGDTMYENEAKDVYMKDDTVDFETQMTASRSRHCECATITYVEPDGSSIDGGVGVGGRGGPPGQGGGGRGGGGH